MRSAPSGQRWNTAGGRAAAYGLAALLVALVGEVLLFRPGFQVPAMGLLIGAAVLGALAWREFDADSEEVESGTGKPISSDNRTLLRVVGIGLSVVMAVGGLAAWFADPDVVFGWQGVLWVTSMALLVVSCLGWGDDTGTVGPPWTRREVALLVGIVVVSLAARLLWLDDVPWRFHYDEAIAYQESMRFFRGPAIPIFTTTWYNTSLPSLPFVFSGWLMHVAGTGLGGTRFGVALLSSLMVIPVYGIGRLLYGRVAGALAAFFMAVSAVAVHYSRISIVNMTTPLAWAVCFYFLLRGLRSRKPLDFALAGLAGGLSMYTFYATRLLPYLIVLFVLYLAIFHLRDLRLLWKHFVLVAMGFLVGFGPLLAYFIRYPEMWASRGLERLTVPASFPTSWDRLVSDFNTLAPLAWQNFLGLSVVPTNDRTYFAPFLLPVEAALLVVGFGALIWRWKQPGSFLVLVWGLGVLFVGGTLVDAGHIPAFVHWSPAFPAFYIVMSLPPALLLRSLREVSVSWWRTGAWAVASGAVLLAVANLYFYLEVYPGRVPPSFEASQGRLLASLSAGERALFVGKSWQGYYPAIGEMMAPQVRARDVLNPARELPPVGDPARGLVFVFNEDEAQYLPIVRAMFPGGEERPMDTVGGPLARTYTVGASAAARRYGAKLTLDDGRQGWEGQVPSLGALPDGGTSVTYPLTATWSGAFYLDRAGVGRLHAREPVSLTLRVGGEPAAPGRDMTLDAGWIPFEVQAVLEDAQSLHIVLQQGTEVAREIPPERLWPLEPGMGLAATFSGATMQHRVDPFIGSGVLRSESRLLGQDPDLLSMIPAGTDRPRAVWEGDLYAEGGTYTMELRTDAHARLSIDGRTVLDLCDNPAVDPLIPIRGNIPPVTSTVTLVEGWHPVRLEYVASGNINGLEWAWTRPDGTREIVPPSRLRFALPDALGEPVRWPDAPGPVTCSP